MGMGLDSKTFFFPVDMTTVSHDTIEVGTSGWRYGEVPVR
jgi:hypothetical protein